MAGLSPAAGARPWLAATSVHSRDASMAQIVGNAAAMCTHYPHLAFIVNFFDHHPLDDSRALDRRAPARPSTWSLDTRRGSRGLGTRIHDVTTAERQASFEA